MSERMECLAPWAVRACGVDWNGGRPIVVEARLRGGRPVCAPLSPETSAAALADAKTAVVGALPPGRAMAVWLQTPLSAPAKARRVLPTLLDMAMPFALEECAYAFSPMVRAAKGGKASLPGDASGTFSALAVAARRSDVAAQLALYAGQGFDPHVLDHEGLALWTEAQRKMPAGDAPGVRAVVWVREGEALLVLGVGLRFWSAHRIGNLAGGTLARTVRVQLDAIAGGAYAKATLTWLWGGPAAAACAALRARVEADLPTAASLSLPDGEAFLAGALAVRALLGGPLRFNLRGDALAHPAVKRQTDAQHRRRAACLAAAALLLLAVNAACLHVRTQCLRVGEAQIKATIDRVAGWPVAAAGDYALVTAQRALDARRDAYRPVIRMFGPSLLETLARVVADASDAGVSLRDLLLRFENVALLGEATAQANAETLVRHLKQAGYDVELKALPQAADSPLVFEVTGTAREQP